MSEDTAIEQSVETSTDLGADLAAAFNENTEDENFNEQEEAAEISEESTETESEIEEVAEPSDEDGEVETEPDDTSDTQGIVAPNHWSAEDQATFNALTELGEQGQAAQDFLLNRHKAMEADYTRKTQEISQFKREAEPVMGLIEPFKPQLQQLGVTPDQYLQRMIQADQFLNQDPKGALQWLAGHYQVDLNELANAPQADPQVQKLQSEIHQLKSTMTQREQQEVQQRQQTLESKINDFSEEKDSEGNPANPHFMDVIDDMITLATAERAAGREPDLKTLYDKAVWANPDVRQKIIAAEKSADEKKRQAEARAKAAKSKKATKVVKSTGAASPSADLTLRDELESHF